MSQTTQEKILNAASQHRELLQALAELDYASPALQQSTSYLTKLSEDIRSLDSQIKKLEEITNKERKEHEDLRDSTARRFAYKITGQKEKFQSRAEKEEREYVEALEKFTRARHQREELLKDRQSAEEQNAELKRAVERQLDTQKQLDILYESIFNGPSPGFPEEDDLERRLHETQQRYNSASARLNTDSQASKVLFQAQTAINRCLQAMDSAHGASQADLFGFGGGFADYFERSSLAEAQNFAFQAENFVTNARSLQPLINSIGILSIAHGHMISDILFDNIFTDLRFHQMIKDSMADVFRYKQILDHEAQLQVGRRDAAGRETEDYGAQLKRSRRELLEARKALFSQVLSEGPTANRDVAAQPSSLTPPLSPANPQGWRSQNPYAAVLAEIGEQHPDHAPIETPPQYTPR